MSSYEIVVTSSMKKNQKTETMSMVLEIFEHAYLEKRDVNEVIGDDLNNFMKGFIKASGGKSSFIYFFSYSSILFIGYLLLMKVYKIFRTDSFSMDNIKNETLDIGLVVTYGIIAYIFFPWLMLVMQKASKKRWRGVKLLWIIIPYLIPLGLVSMLILIDDPKFTSFIDQPVKLFSNLESIMIGVLLLIGSIILLKFEQKRLIRKAN